MTIRLENIRKTYRNTGITAIENFSHDFKDDRFIVFAGRSGTGKTTLLNIISLIDLDYEGDYFLGRRKISSYSRKEIEILRSKYFSVIFQEYELLENESVLENVAISLEKKLFSKKDNEYKVYEMLKKLEIEELMSKKAKFLSGGQRQRVAIARGLIKNPRFIIADEPTSSVDDISKEIILKTLKEYVLENEKRKIFLASHDRDLIDYFDEKKLIDLG